jgi:RNA recognition motif-containing protein
MEPLPTIGRKHLRHPHNQAIRDGRVICVKNMPFNVSAQDFENELASKGFNDNHVIVYWTDPLPGRTGSNRGWVHIQFRTPQLAATALSTLNGITLKGRRLETCWVVDNRRTAPTPNPRTPPTAPTQLVRRIILNLYIILVVLMLSRLLLQFPLRQWRQGKQISKIRTLSRGYRG